MGTCLRTLRFAAQQDVDAAKNLDCLGDGSTAAAHDGPIAAYAAYAVFPTLSVLAIALALIDEVSEFDAAIRVVDLVRR